MTATQPTPPNPGTKTPSVSLKDYLAALANKTHLKDKPLRGAFGSGRRSNHVRGWKREP